MGKPGKFYCHYEAAEVTTPFVIEPGLTFAYVAENFCARYNSKHGAGPGGELAPAHVELKTGGKVMAPGDEVADHVSPGDDVYVSIRPGAGPAAAAAPAADMPADLPRPVVGEKLAKKLKVYVHYEAAAASKDPTATSALQIEDSGKTVGDVIIEFVAGYNAKHAGAPDFTPLQPRDLCARTDSFLVVPADAPVAKTFKNGDDIWIVALETALEENNEVAAVQENANRIQASQQSRKDKSYYYWAQKPTHEAPAPREAPKQIRTREARPEELENFKTVSSYSFEDAGGWVKVYILMKGVGELGDGAISADFGNRNMSVKICGWDNKNWRLQVPKLSEEIVVEECSVKKRADSVLIKLCKKKKDHYWYELFKTKGIGEES